MGISAMLELSEGGDRGDRYSRPMSQADRADAIANAYPHHSPAPKQQPKP